MEIRPSTQIDIDHVQAHPYDATVKGYPVIHAPNENCWTYLVEGNIWAVGGYVVLFEGVGEIWVILIEDFLSIVSATTAIRTIRNQVAGFILEGNLRRIQARVRVDFPEAIKMIESLGFKREGLLKEYAPDKKDMYIYGRVI